MTEVLISSASLPMTGGALYDFEDIKAGRLGLDAHTAFLLDITIDPVLRDCVAAFDVDMVVITATLRKSFVSRMLGYPERAPVLSLTRESADSSAVSPESYGSNHPDATAPLAFEAVREIKDWLQISQQQVLDAAGIVKSTYHGWPRGVSSPRAGSEGRLWSLHLLVKSIVEVKGARETALWVKHHPDLLDALVAGEFDEVSRAAFDVAEVATNPLRAARAAGVDERADLPANTSIDWSTVPMDVEDLDG